MEAVTVPMILSAIGTAATVYGQFKGAGSKEDAAGAQRAAAEQSKRISDRNAARIEAETAESVRRERVAAEEADSMRRARAAAAGGTTYGSTGAFLEEQQQRSRDYIDWLQRSGASRAAIERAQGDYAMLTGRADARATEEEAEQDRWGAFGSLVSGGAKLYDLYDPVG